MFLGLDESVDEQDVVRALSPTPASVASGIVTSVVGDVGNGTDEDQQQHLKTHICPIRGSIRFSRRELSMKYIHGRMCI